MVYEVTPRRDFSLHAEVELWNTTDLGYLAAHAAALIARDGVPAGATSLQAGRLGTITIRDRAILLGQPLIMNKSNIDRLNF